MRGNVFLLKLAATSVPSRATIIAYISSITLLVYVVLTLCKHTNPASVLGILGSILTLEYLAIPLIASLGIDPFQSLIITYLTNVSIFTIFLYSLDYALLFRKIGLFTLRIRRWVKRSYGYAMLAPSPIVLGMIGTATVVWLLGLDKKKSIPIILSTALAIHLVIYLSYIGVLTLVEIL